MSWDYPASTRRHSFLLRDLVASTGHCEKAASRLTVNKISISESSACWQKKDGWWKDSFLQLSHHTAPCSCFFLSCLNLFTAAFPPVSVGQIFLKYLQHTGGPAESLSCTVAGTCVQSSKTFLEDDWNQREGGLDQTWSKDVVNSFYNYQSHLLAKAVLFIWMHLLANWPNKHVESKILSFLIPIYLIFSAFLSLPLKFSLWGSWQKTKITDLREKTEPQRIITDYIVASDKPKLDRLLKLDFPDHISWLAGPCSLVFNAGLQGSPSHKPCSRHATPCFYPSQSWFSSRYLCWSGCSYERHWLWMTENPWVCYVDKYSQKSLDVARVLMKV